MVQSIATQALQFEALKSKSEFDQASYEQSIIGCRNQANTVKQKFDSALRESQVLEAKLAEVELSRSLLQSQLEAYKSDSSTASDQVAISERKLVAATDEKRQLLESLNQKAEEIKELRAERESLRKAGAETRKSVINLETQVQQLQSSQISTKLKEQSQQQELALLKQNTQWLENELKTKNEEHAKFRSEKVELITRLQSDLSNAQSSLQIVKSSNETLKTQFSQTSKQLNDTLVKTKELQDAQAVNQENFRAEMAAQKRLVDLWEHSAKDAKKRVEEMEAQISTLHEKNSKELEKWRSKAAQETERANALEKQISTLEGQIESKLVQSEGSLNDKSPSSNGVFSPSAKIIAEIRNGGGSLTQLYTDYQETKARLERERFKNIKLREQMNEIIREMESNAPAVLAEREENIRLEHELTEMSIQLEDSMKKLESTSDKLKEAEIKSQDNQRESQLLGKQVSDLSRQVQNLLIQNKLISDTENPLTADEHAALQKILRGDNSPNDSDTDKIISQRLVLFKNTVELQKQNANLLKITRELGIRMENKEKEMAQKLTDIESSAVDEAKEAILSLQGDVKSLTIKLKALQNERDMFRRMLSAKSENGVPLTEALETSAEGVANSQIQHYIKQTTELSARNKELEKEFTTFRNESSENTKLLNTKNMELTAERSNLQIQLAKTESKLELSDERQKHAQSNLEIIRSENNEFKKRAQSLEETINKQDVRIQKLSEELYSVQSTFEDTKNQNANLKAEKSIWKSIEERLTKDNADLIEQRGRLNALIANSQQIETERSASLNEMNTRLNKQISTLETEVESLRKKLDTQTEEYKAISQKRESESRDFQERISQLQANLSKSNESLVTSKARYEKLEVNFNNVNKELASTTEQLKKLESINATPGSREFVLSQEISTLKTSLEATKSELALSKKSVEELRGVASSAEKALQDMNGTHDAFKTSTDKLVAEKEASIERFKQQLATTNKILESTRQTYGQLDKERQNKISALEVEQKRLNDLVDVLKANEAKINAEVENIRQDLSQQSKITSDARANYEQELVKHAEAANAFKSLREEHTQLQTKVNELKMAADSAIEKLSSSESSWASQKYLYEQEIENLKSRSEDISAQNTLLLGQLENASNKQQQPPSYKEATEAQDTQLRELISALKREKEIVDTKYELNVQETKRLKQTLDHTTAALDKARVEIEQLHQAQADQQTSTLQKKIEDQTNDINILRESNTTLRQQSNFYSNKTKELEKSVEELKTKLEPLEGRLAEAKAELDAKEAQIKLFQQEANDWKTRTQNILHKYERIDPKVVNDLQESNKSLTQELNDLKAKHEASVAEVSNTKAKSADAAKELSDIQSKFENASKELIALKTSLETANKEVATKTTEITNLNNRFTKIKTEFNDKLRKTRGATTAVKEQLDTANAEIAKLKAQATKASTSELATIKSELESTKQERDNIKSELETVKQNVTQLTAQLESAKAQQPLKTEEGGNADVDLLREQLAAKEAEIATLKQSSGGQSNEGLTEKDTRIRSLEEEVNKLSDQLLDLQNQPKEKEITSLKTANKALSDKIEELSKGGANSFNQEEHEKQLADLRAELETKASQDYEKQKAEFDANLLARVADLKEAAKRQITKIVGEQKKALEKEFKEKEDKLKESQSQASADGANVAGDAESIKKLEDEIKALKESSAEDKKKAIEMTRKEFDMRIRLLQSKAEKAEAEKTILKNKLSALESGSSSTTSTTDENKAPQQSLPQGPAQPSHQPQQQQQKQANNQTDLIPSFPVPPAFPAFANNAGVSQNQGNFNQSTPNAFQFPSNGGFKGMQGSKFPTRGGLPNAFKNNFNNGANNANNTSNNVASLSFITPTGPGAFMNNNNNNNTSAVPAASNKIEDPTGSNDQVEVTGVKRAIDTNNNDQNSESKRSKNEAEEGK